MGERLTAMTESWRPQRREPLFDPQMRRMGLIAGGAAVVLALGVGGYSLLGSRSRGIPVIEADSRPLRVKPENPGGMQVAGAEEQIMGGSGGAQAEAMAPAPEMPQPQMLRAQIQATKQPAPPPAAPAAPAPAPAPAPVVAAVPASPPAIAAKPPVAHTAIAPAAPAAGGMEVQLAALGSEQAATNEWRRLAQRIPELAAHKPAVMKVEHDGKTLYRLRTGGFADTAQATAFCTQVKAKGGGCAIASF